MEAEVREILPRSVAQRELGRRWIEATKPWRGEELTGAAILPDGARKRGLSMAIEEVLLDPSIWIPYDEPTARIYASYRALTRRGHDQLRSRLIRK